ncbi:MAG: TldD/PmbA family protein [Bacilli bacterium]|nr:TldD/PmbA family protein [Bacilli bacterium]
MISKALALEVLNAALATGGDYAEIYVEETTPESFMLENGKVESVGSPQGYGCGLRILNGLRSVYGYTSDLSKKSLLALAEKLSASYEGERKITVEKIGNGRYKKHSFVETHLRDVPAEEKIDYLREISQIISGVDPRIVRVQTGLTCAVKNIDLFVAEGPEATHFHNIEERSRLFMIAIAAGAEGFETYFNGPGTTAGWEFFTKTLDYKKLAKETGEKAVMMLTAKECPSGRYTVVIKNGWGGVLFHEACGHPLEASSTSKGLSVFSDSIGKPIASPCVSAWDDGTIENEWGTSDIDSEGVPTQKNELIRDGICVGFMVDRFSARRMDGIKANGTSRRQSYRYCPTSRMSNTYIAAGKDDPEDIIKDTPLGIYVANFGGGSVNPTTGEFNFSASEAYIIRDGKICEPVKGCTLIGTGQEVLMQIDRVGNDLALGQGNCGAASGSVPVNVGQPTIRLKEITVGGRGGKLE